MMESQYKNGGVDGVVRNGAKTRGGGGGVGGVEIGVRVLALILSLVATILMGIDKQTKTVPITISQDLPALFVPVTAKSSYLSAFGYFVVANSIACAFAAVSLVLAFVSKGGRPLLTIILIDLMMVALLFSGVGSAGAVGVLGLKGNSHLHWNKVCNVYGKFCHQATAAIALSLIAAILYMVLVTLGALKLHKSS